MMNGLNYKGANASAPSQSIASPIPLTDGSRQQLESWTSNILSLFSGPTDEIAQYAIMALLREKYDKHQVIDALLEEVR
ncbi:hypothetical protein BLOT_002770 [Blomia tropicalis]|nr:hypothetical protein BLOT_002770 [Blomia tropicalis]